MPHHDSRIIGALAPHVGDAGDYELGDLIGDDDLIGDLIGELGRRRRSKSRRADRLMRRLGLEDSPADAARTRQQARSEMLRAANMQAYEDGEPLTAGHFVADPGQRRLYLPFRATVSVAGALGSVQTLAVNVQRPILIERIVLAAADSVTAGDALATLGVASVLVGVQPVFNAQGIAPAVAFDFRAVGVRMMAHTARVGVEVTVNLQRIITQANAATASGFLVGVSAEV
jgi:hypothetical protein